MKKLFIVSSLLLLLPVIPAQAATIQIEDNLSISIPVSDDLYAAGGTVRVEEDVKGDLILVGGDIDLRGDVEQDLVLAGGDIDIDGSIGDDLRAAGGTIYLSAIVGDDAILLGGEVSVREDTVIGGDLRVFGGDVVIDGTVRGNVYVRGGSVRLNGNVGGNVDIQSDVLLIGATIDGDVRVSAENLSFENSSIGGNIHYWHPEGEYDFSNVVVAGEAVYDEDLAIDIRDDTRKVTSGILVGFIGYSLLASALIIFLSILITQTYFTDAAKRLQKEPWMSIFYGFLYIILMPFLALIFFLTVIGIPIGLMIIISYLFTFYFIKPLTSIVFAKIIEAKYNKKWGTFKLFLVSFAIFFVWKLIVLIPFIGILVSIAGVLAGFGTLAHTEWLKFKKVR